MLKPDRFSCSQKIRLKWDPPVLSWVQLMSSDVPPPGRGIKWPRVVLHQVSLTFDQPLGQADLLSDVPPGRGI